MKYYLIKSIKKINVVMKTTVQKRTFAFKKVFLK